MKMIRYGNNSVGGVAKVGDPLRLLPDVNPDLAPTNRRRPYIIEPDTIEAGITLQVVPGSWAANPPASTTYQWRRDNVDIPGASGLLYTLTVDDEGTTIDCVESATNSVDTSTAPTSNDIVVPLP